jgi:hypothetical protein
LHKKNTARDFDGSFSSPPWVDNPNSTSFEEDGIHFDVAALPKIQQQKDHMTAGALESFD